MKTNNPHKREEGTSSLVKIYKSNTPGQKKMKTFLEFSGFPPSPTSSTSTGVGTSTTLFSPPKQPKPLKSNVNNSKELETEPSLLVNELRQQARK